MGRFIGFLAEALATARAALEVMALVRARGRSAGRVAPTTGPDAPAAGPAPLAPLDEPEGSALVEPEVRGPQACVGCDGTAYWCRADCGV